MQKLKMELFWVIRFESLTTPFPKSLFKNERNGITPHFHMSCRRNADGTQDAAVENNSRAASLFQLQRPLTTAEKPKQFSHSLH